MWDPSVNMSGPTEVTAGNKHEEITDQKDLTVAAGFAKGLQGDASGPGRALCRWGAGRSQEVPWRGLDGMRMLL